MQEYFVPSGNSETEFIEKRSKFISRIWLTETEEEAIAHIKQMREKHWDATHNVYAYIIKDGATRYSDDGEPQGTAGMPVLDVLRKRELYNVCCVVTRYFGGILLGAGGLVRAYSHSASLAADAAGTSIKRVWSSIDVPCPYNMFERVKQETANFDGIVTDVEYGAQVLVKTILPQANADNFCARLVDMSSGKLKGEITGNEYRAFPVK